MDWVGYEFVEKRYVNDVKKKKNSSMISYFLELFIIILAFKDRD